MPRQGLSKKRSGQSTWKIDIEKLEVGYQTQMPIADNVSELAEQEYGQKHPITKKLNGMFAARS
ncbi:MAG TPA: hypothetical protein VMY43_02500 [Methanothrix sp.]|nr:hypothetical protein [Methanothrix sp.]